MEKKRINRFCEAAALTLALALLLALTGMGLTERVHLGTWGGKTEAVAFMPISPAWGLALLLKDHPVWGCILWGLAAATKLQAGLLFPLLLVFFMKGRVSIRHLLREAYFVPGTKRCGELFSEMTEKHKTNTMAVIGKTELSDSFTLAKRTVRVRKIKNTTSFGK